MEDSHSDDLQFAHMWEKDFSDGSEEPPRKVPRSEPSLCDVSGKLPFPGKFMKLAEVLTVLRNAENGLESLPQGEKNNVFFIVNDSENIMKREKNMQTAYRDGCGAWDCSKYKTSSCYIDPMSKRRTLLKLKDGLFCRYVSQKKECGHSWNPVNPQPNPKTLLKLHRFYTTLKSDSNYKRRITSVSGNEINNLALIEYSGVKRTPCINTKRRQTNPKRLEKINEEINYKPKRQVYKEMLKDGKHRTPKNIKQVANIQYSAARRKQYEMLSKVPDEKQILLTMLAEYPSVQAIINRKGKPPCVILYSDEQFSDMKRNLEWECETVLGVDCSHKFGDCFVTMTVYQNSRALHKETNEPLLYPGPVFLHWDEEFLTYVYFFSHIMDKLEDIEPNFEVKLGSKSNLSLFKALKHTFPTSEHILNSCHLKETVVKELPDVLNGKIKECSIISEKIFGSDGIVSSPSLCTFENRVMNLASSFDKFFRFKTYFGRLQVLLYRYVCEPQQRGVSQKLWLNGSDKVLNDYLKKIKKGPHKLPELMEKVCNMITHLMMEVEKV